MICKGATTVGACVTVQSSFIDLNQVGHIEGIGSEAAVFGRVA